MPAIDIIGIEKCAGCFACYNACPFDAIEMKVNEEGFYKPKINRDKCTECGICQKVCPVIETNTFGKFQSPKAYAAWSNDDYVRVSATSGGIATELANLILDENGVVYGVVWNEKWYPQHMRATRDEKYLLEEMKGSKYVPSYIGMIYRNIIRDLKEGRKVLFIGLPCQVAGLNNFIHLKSKTVETSNLYCVDLVCHGVPSLTVWSAYLMYLQKKMKDKKIISIKMRDKSLGWIRPLFKVEFEGGKVYTTEFFTRDWFGWGFLNNYYLNLLCYDCPFSKIPRYGCITIGDFWGIHRRLYDLRGISLILVNDKKGEELVEKLKVSQRITIIPVDFKEIALIAPKVNPRILSHRFNKPKERERIIKVAREEGFNAVIRVLKKERVKIAVSFAIKHPIQTLRIIAKYVIKD